MHGNIGFEKNQWKVEEDETVIVDPAARKIQEQQERHNWKATAIAVCAITLVLLAVSTAALLLGAEDENEAFWSRVPYDLHSALEDEICLFVGNSTSSQQWRSTRWITDHQLVYWDSFGGLSLFDADVNRSSLLVPASVILQWRTEDYWPSFDGRYVLLRQRALESGGTSPPPAADHKQEAFYAVYDTRDKDLWKVRLRAEELQGTSLSYATWTGRSNHLVVVHRSRIYWTRDATSRTDWQLRGEDFQDHPDLVVGLPDWTYSEGTVRWKSLMWPDRDGVRLLYAVLNASQCYGLDYVDYLPDGSQVNSIHYAVPGGRLPEIQLRLMHLENGTETALVQLNRLAALKEWLLVQVEWLDVNSFVTAWMSRNQNHTSVFHCVVGSSKCTQVFKEESEGNQRRLKPPQLFSSSYNDGGGFLLASEAADFTTVAADTGRHSSKIVIHRPPWQKTVSVHLEQLDVQRIVGWNESNQTIYILGSPMSAPHQRHLYKILLGADPECLTCDEESDVDDHHNNCDVVDVFFDPQSASYYEIHCLGPHIPGGRIVNSEDDETVVTLWKVEEEGQVRDLLEHLTPIVRYLDVPLADGSIGRAQLLLPRTWTDKTYHKLLFPLVVQTLDWDEEDSMIDRWRNDWAEYFAVTRQVVYARISGRERSSNRYGSIRLATEDVLTIINWIVAELRHVDSRSVVIMGKGVGGYLAFMAMANDVSNVLSCGILMSPTVDWLRQETTVAEKFLGHFGDNQEHYVLARIEEHVPHIKNNTLLLIDSIPYSPVEHFQVFKLSQLLVKAGTLFQYKVYPRTAAMKVVQYHYYLSIEFFITQCLSSTGN